ncbi:MAG: hypothetical protein JW995_04200 [Melioribacteraceae bacterium]|nr:hypothetical protein [Melioribacteraceae bacterium]
MIKPVYPALILLTVFFLYTCKQSDSGNVDELDFELDEALLAETVTFGEFQFSFKPPLYWDEYKSEFSDRMIATIKQKSSGNAGYSLSPLKIYFNPGSNSTITVGKLAARSDSVKGSINDYIAVLNSLMGNEIQRDGIIKKNRNLHYLITEKENLISYKIVASVYDGTLIQFDYTTMKINLDNVKPSILSSIASIKISREK